MRTSISTACAAVLGLALGTALPEAALAGGGGECGDGVVEGFELCDDGNTVDGDGCSTNCLAEICGDGFLENNGRGPDEQCDDGNTVSGDGCQSDCTCDPDGCGDGIVSQQCGEECDDGNKVDDDACGNECIFTPGCGNGLVEGGEQCDDGNTIAGDGCTPSCLVEPYSPTKPDQACVNAVNKAWAGVVRVVNKAGGKCLKGVSSGKVAGAFTDCAQAADVERTFDKTTKAHQKKCFGKVDTRMFGYIGDPAAVNLAGLDGSLGAQIDVLGSPANVVPKSDKEHARCQREVHKGLIRYSDALAADANFHKKACLKDGQCRSSSDLALVMRVGGRKGPKALCRWTAKVAKKCTDTTVIAAQFPGACASSPTYADLVTCAAGRARHHVCASFDVADGLASDCAEFANDPQRTCAGP